MEKKIKNCDVLSFVSDSVVAGQFVRFKHGNEFTKFVCCMDFVEAFNDFVKDNPAMGDRRFLPKVQKVVPAVCEFDNGKEGIVLTIELFVKNATVWHLANSVDSYGCSSCPIED